MEWYWCIAQCDTRSGIATHRFQAESVEDAKQKGDDWWKKESGSLKHEFFLVAQECYYHERKYNERPFRERWKPKQ